MRILSVAWSFDDKILVTGNSNAQIQVFNNLNGKLKFNIDITTLHKEVLIWAIDILKDYTIVSGDSRGKTSFWDGKMGTLLKEFPSHQSDILVVSKDKDENVYLSGVDQLITKFSRKDSRWFLSGSSRVTRNDVNSLCLTNDSVITDRKSVV